MTRRYSRRFWLAMAAVLVLTTSAAFAPVLLDGAAGVALAIAGGLASAVPIVLVALWQHDVPARD